jgi:hypothetical protein
MTVTVDDNHEQSSQEQETVDRRDLTHNLLEIFHRIPSLLLVAAAVLLLLSLSEPYWSMHLDAAQYDYRDGLDVLIYVDRMESGDPEFDDLREINSLNHYIGMRPLDDAARFERSIGKPSAYIFSIGLIIAAIGLALYRQRLWSKWFWLLAVPTMLYPAVFVADLAFWLRDSGQSLDCLAPLSFSIERFTPPLSGEGTVGQFTTSSQLDTGWNMALYAAILVGAALLFALLRFGYVCFVRFRLWMQSRSQQTVSEATGA